MCLSFLIHEIRSMPAAVCKQQLPKGAEDFSSVPFVWSQILCVQGLG